MSFSFVLCLNQGCHISGGAPAVIAKGGFSGLFPDSSLIAYNFVSLVSSNDTTLWCNVQLTKDGIGVCLPDINLDNCTDIGSIFPQNKATYVVDGINTSGWFSVDFTLNDLSQVSCKYKICLHMHCFKTSVKDDILIIVYILISKASNLFSNT